MEIPLAPPRVTRLRRTVGVFLDHLRFFGIASGPHGQTRLNIPARNTPADIAAYTAADLTVRWANMAVNQRSAAGGSLPARQEPVDSMAVSAALPIACRACALSLTRGGLIAEDSADGTPVGIIM